MREATERLLVRTRYEIEVDPYRGIYDGRYGFDPPNGPLRPIDRRAGFGDDDNDDVMAVDDVPKPPPPTNPWGAAVAAARRWADRAVLVPTPPLSWT